MSDVFQEVEEEYRREQMAKFWEKYRFAVIGGVAALIAGVGAYQAWSYWRASQIEASSRGFEIAAEMAAAGAGKEKEAADALAKIAAGGSGGYPLVAQFQEAALRAEMGDVKAAVKLYDALAAKGTGGTLFSDYARLRAGILLVDNASIDEVKKRLEPVAAATGERCGPGDSPWCVQALELLAYANWRAGKKAEALKLYSNIMAFPVERETPLAAEEAQGPKKRYVSRFTHRRALEMTALIEDGMTLADIKTPPAPANEPLLLPPTLTPEDPSSLLGPSPEHPPTP